LWPTLTGEVAFLGTISEEGRKAGEKVGAVIALRLKVVNRQTPEVETLVAPTSVSRKISKKSALRIVSFRKPYRGRERMYRDDLVKTANMYFTGMQQNDGRGVYPFTDDCNRIENRSQTTNAPSADGKPVPDSKPATSYSQAWSCRQQFESGLLHFVTRIRDRGYVAQTPDGRTVTAGPNQPCTWELAELFKIEKGRLRQIEAIMDRSPYGMISGWSNWKTECPAGRAISNSGPEIRPPRNRPFVCAQTRRRRPAPLSF
jgi:hypothetical protein